MPPRPRTSRTTKRPTAVPRGKESASDGPEVWTSVATCDAGDAAVGEVRASSVRTRRQRAQRSTCASTASTAWLGNRCSRKPTMMDSDRHTEPDSSCSIRGSIVLDYLLHWYQIPHMVGAVSAELRALHAQGRDAWPQLDVDLAAFSQSVEGRLAPDEVARLHAGDLYLSVACARGDTRALALVDEQYIATLVSALPGYIQRAVADDVIQLVRLRFLIGEEGRPPRIGDFDGTARLATWLRVAAIRIAISLHRKVHRETMIDDVGAVADAPDPELALLQRQYGAEFRAAFRHGFVSLTARERNLLRYHILDSLGIDGIAALYG